VEQVKKGKHELDIRTMSPLYPGIDGLRDLHFLRNFYLGHTQQLFPNQLDSASEFLVIHMYIQKALQSGRG
jgi:hypothetical protein